MMLEAMKSGSVRVLNFSVNFATSTTGRGWQNQMLLPSGGETWANMAVPSERARDSHSPALHELAAAAVEHRLPMLMDW